jgi:hypothetical protein
VDGICLQETIKSDFTVWDLTSLCEGESYEWSWTAASGHSGGTLTGVNTAVASVVGKDHGSFFSSLVLVSREDNFKWELINVYGPVQNERKLEFIQEMNQKISDISWPVVVGGDLNMIRYAWEKSSDNINHFWMDTFNGFILDNGLLELHRIGGKYTWSNKQANPIMCVLDRVLVCSTFNSRYGEASCETITRVGSDHNPLVVNTADNRFRQKGNFRFEMYWLDQQGFREMVLSKWPMRGDHSIQDFWKDMKAATRKFCRGWGTNNQSQLKKDKKFILGKIEELDREAEQRDSSITHWQMRYNLEAELEKKYTIEELHLKRQSGIKWTLKGDANNSFFHGSASGRRRRCSIFYLEENGEEIRELAQIRSHVDQFYKKLFSAEAEGEISLGKNFWEIESKLTLDEANELIKPFSLKEIEDALEEMDCSSAPGPDGFPVGLYKIFWNEIKQYVLEMFNNFHSDHFNLKRLNFGMISLIPKLKEANNIRQFRPIRVLNVDYKWFIKTLTMRLTPFANKLISKNQTAFIPGRFILEGVVILHEILHDLRTTKTKGVVVKLDFEKAYDKVHWNFLFEVLR